MEVHENVQVHPGFFNAVAHLPRLATLILKVRW
jgi:hypothetical protein